MITSNELDFFNKYNIRPSSISFVYREKITIDLDYIRNNYKELVSNDTGKGRLNIGINGANVIVFEAGAIHFLNVSHQDINSLISQVSNICLIDMKDITNNISINRISCNINLYNYGNFAHKLINEAFNELFNGNSSSYFHFTKLKKHLIQIEIEIKNHWDDFYFPDKYIGYIHREKIDEFTIGSKSSSNIVIIFEYLYKHVIILMILISLLCDKSSYFSLLPLDIILSIGDIYSKI